MRTDITLPIAAAPQRVWELVADVEGWPSWTESVTSVQLPGGELAVGSRVRVKQPRLPRTTWTVTELSPGRSFTWVAAGLGFRSTGVHRVEPSDGDCVVTLVLDQVGPVGRLVGLLYRGLTKKYVAMEAHGLKARAESPRSGPAG